MVSGFEGGKAEWLGNGTHHEDIGQRVDVAEAFAADETSKDGVFADAEFG